jgi:hypothetical protein
MDLHLACALIALALALGFLCGIIAALWSKAPVRQRPDRSARDLDRIADSVLENAVSLFVSERPGCSCTRETLCDVALAATGAPKNRQGAFTAEQRAHAAWCLYHLGGHVGRRWREFRKQEEGR